MKRPEINVHSRVHFLSISIFAFASFFFPIQNSAFAQTKPAPAAQESASTLPTADNIRCETMAGMKLSEFKTKLVENCNLNKPFSSSASRILNEDTFFYCCHKR